MKEITCPECNGKGTIEVETRVTRSGAQQWTERECPECEGWGTVEVEIEVDNG